MAKYRGTQEAPEKADLAQFSFDTGLQLIDPIGSEVARFRSFVRRLFDPAHSVGKNLITFRVGVDQPFDANLRPSHDFGNLPERKPGAKEIDCSRTAQVMEVKFGPPPEMRLLRSSSMMSRSPANWSAGVSDDRKQDAGDEEKD